MKAKLPEAERDFESGTRFLCIWCDTVFVRQGPLIKCPSCANQDEKDIIPIYLEDDPQEEALYTRSDFSGG